MSAEPSAAPKGPHDLPPPPYTGALSARRAVGLVARREITGRLGTRSFLLSTVGLLAALGVYALIIGFVRDGPATVGLDRTASALRPALVQAAGATGTEVRFVAAPHGGGEGARAALREDALDAVVTVTADGGLRIGVERRIDADLLAVVRSALVHHRTDAELTRLGTDPKAFRERVATAGVEVDALEAEGASAAQQFALVFSSTGLLYAFFVFFGIMLAQGVVEEKTSRVVELLLSTIRPWHLLVGKVVGVAVVGTAQLLVLGGSAVLVVEVTGVVALPAAAAGTVLSIGVWFLLGFLIFALVLAAAAARVARQEDLQPVVQPVMVLITAPFVLGLALLSRDPHDPVIEWLSLVPLLSPVLMPARMVLGTAPLWQVALSLSLAAVTLVALVRLAGRAYANSVLSSGSRVPLAVALRRR
ncbi:ABC transporter permease [Streptomyces sp. JNUCC 64]